MPSSDRALYEFTPASETKGVLADFRPMCQEKCVFVCKKPRFQINEYNLPKPRKRASSLLFTYLLQRLLIQSAGMQIAEFKGVFLNMNLSPAHENLSPKVLEEVEFSQTQVCTNDK